MSTLMQVGGAFALAILIMAAIVTFLEWYEGRHQ